MYHDFYGFLSNIRSFPICLFVNFETIRGNPGKANISLAKGCYIAGIESHMASGTMFIVHMLAELCPADTVSPKRKYTLLSSRVLKTEGGQMKGWGCAKPTIELVVLVSLGISK